MDSKTVVPLALIVCGLAAAGIDEYCKEDVASPSLASQYDAMKREWGESLFPRNLVPVPPVRPVLFEDTCYLITDELMVTASGRHLPHDPRWWGEGWEGTFAFFGEVRGK